MRYQTEIVERLSEGLASVSLETAAEFREAFTHPFPDLESFCLKVAEYYSNLLVRYGYAPVTFDLPEDTEAISYWIDLLEAETLSNLRKAVDNETRSSAA
ncbi:TPA: hypothetical protein ORQ81_000090 [Escherichia coli]|nr:hypothetical protein [Salmonella enterica subsp. enterica serovar Braenderup]ECG2575717.1 hypothetical protein [Salmonella enterica subsp. enterica serovar Kedougou]EDC4983427.1 hypothetical protein [Salmonella enterica]HCS5018596.1 hypothetical protein [Escherichia coli]EGH2802961.1 hypothetical protein [Salmonella enterica]